MRHLIFVFAIAFFVSACEQNQTEPTDKQPATKTEQAQPAKEGQSGESEHNHDDHAGHNHPPMVASELGYSPIEKSELDSCEKPTVIEIFAYQCPHCYKLEEHAKKWKESVGDKVNFITLPTELGRKEFVPFLAIHYTADKLGVLDQIKPQLFDMIHNNKPAFSDFEGVVKMFTAAGVEEQAARDLLQNDAYIMEQMQKTHELMIRYKVTGVPRILVNYSYATDVSEAGGYENVFKAVDKALLEPNSCK